MAEAIPETKVEEVKTQDQAQNPPEESKQQIDWKRFKEARALERQQKEAAEKTAAEEKARADALKLALEAVVNKPSQAPAQSTEDLSEEERLQRKIDQAIEQRDQAREKDRQKREEEEMPLRLKEAYQDWDEVCSDENIDYLRFHYPEIARAFKNAPDSFAKWSDVYKAIKRFIPNTSSGKDSKKAEKNLNKPTAMSVPGAGQTGDNAPRMLPEEKKKANWARMQQRIKGLS